MGKIKLAIVTFIFFFLFPIFTVKAMGASFLSLSPAELTAGTGDSFNVDVNVDTGSQDITGIDMIINYDPTLFKMTNFTKKDLLGSNQPDPVIDESIGRVMYHPTTASATDTYMGKGSIATMTFKGVKTGKGEMTISCNAGKTQGDSNIWSKGSDIIDCTLTKGGTYTIGRVLGDNTQLAQAAITPVPTAIVPTATTTATATSLPSAGATENTLVLLFSGVIFITIGTKLLLAKSS